MFDRLRALCTAETDNLSDLADIASPDDPAFFDGAQFYGADIRHTDLTRFQLLGVALAGANIDGTTILPDRMPLRELAPESESVSRAVESADAISTIIQTDIFYTLSSLEKKAFKQEGSNIRGPVARKHLNIPKPNDTEREFKLSSVRRLRNLATEILATNNADLTIGSVVINIERLVRMVLICQTIMAKYELRAYQRFTKVVGLEVRKLRPLDSDNSDSSVALSREQWQAVLSRLRSSVSTKISPSDFGTKIASGDVFGHLLVRLFDLLEELKDIYLALPADQTKIDPISFQLQFPNDEVFEEYDEGASGSYAM